MRSVLKAALCACLVMAFGLAVPAQQKKEIIDSEKVRRLDIVPEPLPSTHPKYYPGTSFRSLRVPEVVYSHVDVNGKSLFYERIGYGREIVVVVHGGPGLPHNYLLPALQCLAPYASFYLYDARGHGLSEQNYPNEAYTMEQLVDDIDGFVKAVGIQSYTLFGHSFGGMVALKYATRKPIEMKRLVLSDTSASLDYIAGFQDALKKLMTPNQYEDYEKVRDDESLPPDQRLRKALRMVYPFYWYNPPRKEWMDQDIYSMNLNALAADQIWASDGQNYDVRNDLSKIDVPTIVMVGRYDIVYPVDEAKKIVNGIRNSRLVVFERSGHYPFFEESHTFTQYFRTFLEYYAS